MINRLLNIQLKFSLVLMVATSIIFISPLNLICQTVTVPPEIHLPLLLKVLSFDRNIEKKDQIISIGILYQSKYRNSTLLKNEIIEIINSASIKKINNKSIKMVAFDVDDIEDIDTRLRRHHIDYLYITPLRAVSIDKISEITQAQGITTVSGVPEYIYNGISVGIDLKNSRPSIILNLKSALKEGADFDSQLMRIARIIE